MDCKGLDKNTMKMKGLKMKRTLLTGFLLITASIGLAGCASNSRTSDQDLEESPCACFDEGEYEMFNGKSYKIKKMV